MLASSDLAQLVGLCKAIGNEVTDEVGFVAVRKLLSRFHAKLHIRPLLVEGMVAYREQGSGRVGDEKWAVLIDSETHPVRMEDVLEERPTKALPPRMRNTIAHELVHSLAFRSMEFGIRLKHRSESKEGKQELLDSIERETESLSPLLLWSQKGLEMILREKKKTLSLPEFLEVIKNVGISRYVLVNRLLLLQRDSEAAGFLVNAALRNLAVGIGVWRPEGTYLKGWPIFWNFDNGIVPSRLFKLIGNNFVPTNEIFDGELLSSTDASNDVRILRVDAGTQSVPKAKTMEVEVAIENVSRREDEEFLFVIRRVENG